MEVDRPQNWAMGWKNLEKLLLLSTGGDEYSISTNSNIEILIGGGKDVPNLRELNSEMAKKHKLGAIPLFFQ